MFNDNILRNLKFLLFILLLTIISRLFSSINYLEDIDSLRFALSAQNYDVLNNQPHFPGYPVYCFLLSLLYFLTNSLPISTSLIGGISVFFIIYFTQKINFKIFKRYSIFLFFIIFFNPFLWLMSNRYMPDLLGLSILVSGIYYIIKNQSHSSPINLFKFAISLALLSGVRISYLPFFLPILFLLKISDLKYIISISFLFFLIWFIPWIYITDLSDLINTAINDSRGHFFRWGGTVMSDNSSFQTRFIKIIESISADSLGMWWNQRHWITFINSMFLIPFLIYSIIIILKNKIYSNRSFIIIASCFTSYFLWVYFFQNIVYKPRHLMPFIPMFCFLISFSYAFTKNKIKNIVLRNILVLILVPYIFITLKLVTQHTNPSTISQLSSYIQDSSSQKKIIISHHLMNYYFSKTIDESIIYLNKKSYQSKSKHYYNNNYRIFSTSELNNKEYNLLSVNRFYHNPYVNKLWSSLTLYEYARK